LKKDKILEWGQADDGYGRSRISILIFRWLLFTVLGIIGIAAAIAGIAYAYNYLTYERHASAVKMGVLTYSRVCKDDAFL
jgi:hypothetical protein